MNQTLRGKRIVITRAQRQSADYAERLRRHGAEVIECPTIEIRPPENFGPLDEAIAGLPRYGWIIFTSVNGVLAFWERLVYHGRDATALAGRNICAIGPATAEALQACGLSVDLVPERFQAEGILDAWADVELRGLRILLPRATVARDVLPEELRKAGAHVDVVPVYQTIPTEAPEEVRRLLLEGGADVVTFTSPSTVENFCAMFSREERARLPGRFLVATIGPITRRRAESLGLEPQIEAASFTVPALVDAIVRYFDTLSRVDSPPG